nr:hypothetical protein Iba_chr14dCG15410 [Ipomoea batatas]
MRIRHKAGPGISQNSLLHEPDDRGKTTDAEMQPQCCMTIKSSPASHRYKFFREGALFPNKPSSPRLVAQAFTRSSSSVSGSADFVLEARAKLLLKAKTYTSQLPLKAHRWSRVKAPERVGLRELAAATILSASNIINAVPGGVADSQAYSEAA